jgi:hypothetical protein
LRPVLPIQRASTTRRMPVEQLTTALDHQPDDIKVVVDFS